jgi:hypothetical protein
MKRPAIFLCSAAVALFTSAVFAQEDAAMGPPKPAKELEKLSRLIGYWKGEGTSKGSPDQPAGKWTSTSHVRKVLDGHFLREDTIINGEGWPAPLQFISFMGYDTNKKQLVTASVSNMGTAEICEINFEDDNTMVTVGAKRFMGKPVVERWVTKLGDGTMSYVGHEAVGSGDWFVHVKGTSTKVDKLPMGKIANASFMASAGDEMGKLKNLVGTMTFKGEMIMMPGSPAMQISGESVTESIFGGTVLQTIVTGDPSNGHTYRGWCAMVWDPNKKEYVSLCLNNMGESGIQRGTWVSDTELLFTCACPYYGGIPSVHSGVMKCDKDGTLKSYTSYSIIGTHKPLKSFHIDYSKK